MDREQGKRMKTHTLACSHTHRRHKEKTQIVANDRKTIKWN